MPGSLADRDAKARPELWFVACSGDGGGGLTDLRERLTRGPVLGDGGYLLELEKRGYVRAGPFTPEVSIEQPEALVQLHREFIRAGAEVIQALTFYASEDKLATVGLGGRVDDINRAAVRAGVGSDLVIGETVTWPGEALIAVERGRATGLPVMVTMSFEKDSRSYEGQSPGECAKRLRDAGADVVGVNCLRGPEQTLPIAEEMVTAVDGFVAAQPVAYRTTDDVPDFTSLAEFPFALDPLQLPRQAMASFARKARDAGVAYIGSCCGSVAAHVKAMAQALGKRPVEEGEWRVDYDRPMSAFEYYRHEAPEDSH